MFLLASIQAFHTIFVILNFLPMYKLIPLLILASVALTSCGNSSQQNTLQNQTPPETQGVAKTYEEDIKTVSSKIKDSDEFKTCMNMQVPQCIKSAGMEIARTAKSSEFCQELPDEASRESCIFAVTLINAEEKGDTSLCQNLGNTYKQQCIDSITRSQAVTKKDITLCNALATASGETDQKDMCIMQVITTNSESTKDACDALTGDMYKKTCEATMASRKTLVNPQR